MKTPLPPPGLLVRLLAFLLESLFLSTLACLLHAQTQSKPAPPMPDTAYKLIAVNVTGSKRFTAEEVAAACGLPAGTVAHEEDFKKAARQLGESGGFGDISFTFSYSAAGTKLEFRVTDADKFVPARFLDFVWFGDDDLRRKVHERVPLFNGELPVSGRLADQVSDVLQAVLVENNIAGHVEYSVNRGKNGQMESVDYDVAGVSIRIHAVEFAGAEVSDLPLLQEAAARIINREYSRDYMTNFVQQLLLPVYHEHGYLKASSGTPQIKVVRPAAPELDLNQRPRTYVDVIFPVTPGVHYKFTHSEWSGNTAIATDALQGLLHAKGGQTANTVQLEDDLRAAQELYGSRGYVTATIRATADYDDAAGTVAYRLLVNEGPVYHMGELEFRGIDNSLTNWLQAAWKLRKGDVYDAGYIKQFLPVARKLLPASLDWEVSTHVTAIAADKTVDVDIQYTAKAPQ